MSLSISHKQLPMFISKFSSTYTTDHHWHGYLVDQIFFLSFSVHLTFPFTIDVYNRENCRWIKNNFFLIMLVQASWWRKNKFPSFSIQRDIVYRLLIPSSSFSLHFSSVWHCHIPSNVRRIVCVTDWSTTRWEKGRRRRRRTRWSRIILAQEWQKRNNNRRKKTEKEYIYIKKTTWTIALPHSLSLARSLACFFSPVFFPFLLLATHNYSYILTYQARCALLTQHVKAKRLSFFFVFFLLFFHTQPRARTRVFIHSHPIKIFSWLVNFKETKSMPLDNTLTSIHAMNHTNHCTLNKKTDCNADHRR